MPKMQLNFYILKYIICNNNLNRKRDNITAINRFVISFCLYKGLCLAHKHLTGQMRCSHLVLLFEFSVKNITLNGIIPFSCSFIFGYTEGKHLVFQKLNSRFR